jgi:serine/threonine protein kinase/tetratricopeptide (TPR) repeat protein
MTGPENQSSPTIDGTVAPEAVISVREADATQDRGADQTAPPLDSGGTMDYAPPAAASRVDEVAAKGTHRDPGTVDFRPSDPDGTMDFQPATPTGDAPGGTMNFQPSAEGDPGATADFRPAAPTGAPSGKRKFEVPQSVAGYEVLGVLGRGAMGVVYKARQRGLQRLVALKMILSGEHASELDLARFRAEANAVAQLQHPGIVQIYEVGEDARRPFFSLEFVDGEALDKKIQGTPMAPAQAADLVQKMAEAMAYAHQHGVVHRDLKPANVLMMLDGTPKIGDFGLAKRIDENESGLTRTGVVMGTPSYMSPEQAEARADDVGPLSDVYSLGAILYDLLTGRPPFRGTSVMDTLQQLRTREPVPPVQLQPGVPHDLETICLKCLQKEGAKRYASATELAADLKRFLNGEPIHARPVSRAERLWRWCRRNPGKAAASAAAVLGILIYALSVSVLAGLLNVQKEEAVSARNDAVKSEAEAKRQTIIAEKKTVIAEQNEERQRQTGTVALHGMVDVVDRLHKVMQSKRLSIDASPEIRKLRADVLADLRKQVVAVSAKIQTAATDTFADLLVAQLLGDRLLKLGQTKEARATFEAGLKAAKRRVDAEPDNDKARGNLGVMEQRLGDVALELEGDAHTARRHYLECRRLHEQIREAPKSGTYPALEINRILAHDDIHLGKALVALGRSAEARKYFQEAQTYFEEWLQSTKEFKYKAEPTSYIVMARMWLGIASGNLGDGKATEEHFKAAIALGLGLLQKYPDDVSFIADLAEVQGAYGDALLRLGKPDDAEKSYLESLKNLKAVLAKRPDEVADQPLLALTNERLATVSSLRMGADAAKQYHKEAVQLRKDLWEVEKSNLWRQIGFVLEMARAGERSNAPRLVVVIRPRMAQSPALTLQVARCLAILSSDDAASNQKYLEPALTALAQATADDFKDALVLETDPDLAALRNEPRFKKLIAQIKAR